MRTLAIVNQKGGCGKTTTAINLSAVFAASGLRTLLVDLDPQAHCALGLAVPEKEIDRDIGDAMLAERQLEPSRLIWRVCRNLDLAPSRTKLAALEASRGGLASAPERERRLAKVLQRLREDSGGYDICVIDCPPSIGLLTYNALTAASEVLIPVETSFFSLEGASRQLATIRSLGRRLGVRHTVRVLATLHEPTSSLARDLLEELKRRFQGGVIPVTIRMDDAVKEAASFGRPVIDHNASSRVAKDYLALGTWLISQAGTRRAERAAESGAEGGGFTPSGWGGEGSGGSSGRPLVEVSAAATAESLRAMRMERAGVGMGAGAGSSPSYGAGRDAGAERHAPTNGQQTAPAGRSVSSNGTNGTSGTAGQDATAEPRASAEVVSDPAVAASPGMTGQVTGQMSDKMTGQVSASPAADVGAEAISRIEDVSRRAMALRARMGAEPERLRVKAMAGALTLVEPERPETSTPKSVERLFGARASGSRALFVQPLTVGERVFVAGSFNGWSMTRHEMKRNEQLGVHELSVDVGPGSHQYRLVVDDRWINDPHQTRRAPNEFGGFNNVVEVPEAGSGRPG